jgi:hypothetical protein
MGDRDHKTIRARDADGRHVRHVYDIGQLTGRWKKYPSGTAVPTKDRLFNFDLKVGDDAILVLDNYGDETLPSRVRRRIMREKMFENTIGIHRRTGEIVIVGFILEYQSSSSSEPTALAACYWPFGDLGTGKQLFVPKPYMSRLDELKSKKRPFYISVAEHTLYAFMEREASYPDMERDLVVDLEFQRDERVQVWGESYRVVSGWTDNDNTKNGHDALTRSGVTEPVSPRPPARRASKPCGCPSRGSSGARARSCKPASR